MQGWRDGSAVESAVLRTRVYILAFRIRRPLHTCNPSSQDGEYRRIPGAGRLPALT